MVWEGMWQGKKRNKEVISMAARKGKMVFVLLNEDNGTYESFETEEELTDFLKEEDFDRNELEDVIVVEVETEYEVTPSYELEEVE